MSYTRTLYSNNNIHILQWFRFSQPNTETLMLFVCYKKKAKWMSSNQLFTTLLLYIYHHKNHSKIKIFGLMGPRSKFWCGVWNPSCISPLCFFLNMFLSYCKTTLLFRCSQFQEFVIIRRSKDAHNVLLCALTYALIRPGC